MSLTYAQWNEAIFRHFFSTEQADELVKFFVEPRSLRVAARELMGREEFPSDEEALDDFLRAVKGHLQRAGWALGPLYRSPPQHLGLLALQVLAGYEMRDGVNYTRLAYWPRLRELLGQPKEPRIPDGLSYPEQDELWDKGYRQWLNLSESGKRGLPRVPPPRSDAKRRRRSSYPLAQVLLRKADLDALWRFYEVSGLQPGENLSAEEILEQLQGCREDLGSFSRHARRLLFESEDEEDQARLLAACDQIAEHLSGWDGQTASRPLRDHQRASERVWIHWHRDNLTGGLVARAGPDWRLQPEAPPIQELLRTPAYRVGRRSLWLFVYDEGECRYLNQRSARSGERVILLACASDARFLDRGFAQLGVVPTRRAENVRNAPSGWTAFELIVPQVQESPRFPLDFIRPGRGTIRLLGGLKLRRNVWMAGAGPTVEVLGSSARHLKLLRQGASLEEVRVDGGRAALSTDIRGDYSVWLPGDRRFAIRFRVRKPIRRHRISQLGWHLDPSEWPLCGVLAGDQAGLRGMEPVGPWGDPSPQSTQNLEQLLLRLAVLARLPRVDPYVAEVRGLCAHAHPLVRTLALRIASRREKRRA